MCCSCDSLSILGAEMKKILEPHELVMINLYTGTTGVTRCVTFMAQTRFYLVIKIVMHK